MGWALNGPPWALKVRALIGPLWALMGQALVGPLLARTSQASIGRALMGAQAISFCIFPLPPGPKQLMHHPHIYYARLRRCLGC